MPKTFYFLVKLDGSKSATVWRCRDRASLADLKRSLWSALGLVSPETTLDEAVAELTEHYRRLGVVLEFVPGVYIGD